MAEKGLPAPKIHPTPKAVRAKMDQTKAVDQAKTREPSQKNYQKQNPPKQNPPKQDPPLEP